jgi:AP-3 complex subunit sigma
MIKGILIINNHGKPRLVKFYQSVTDEAEQQSVIRRVFQQVAQRPDSFCNYLEGSIPEWGDTTKIIYRHYATLYFVFAVDQQESDLGILDLIQVFVESLDKCFENVCELDLIFHSDKVNYLLDEIIMAGQSLAPVALSPVFCPAASHSHANSPPPRPPPLGMVLETNINHILTSVNEQNKLHAASNKVIGSSSVAGSVSGALGLSGQKR